MVSKMPYISSIRLSNNSNKVEAKEQNGAAVAAEFEEEKAKKQKPIQAVASV